MSSPLAIAAVTSTLVNLLTQGVHADSALSGAKITAQPPDKAHGADESQLNIFLYQTTHNLGWQNGDPPRGRPGETARPPLALNLHYLLTVWGKGNDDVLAHRVLGRAMRVLHDHPLLGRAEIKAALPGNDLYDQVERIRISPQPLSLDELSKLWTIFGKEYRASTGYEASVVLLDSVLPARTPLPVLTRGAGDEGVAVQPELTPPFPTLEAIEIPNGQPSARLEDVLTLRGHHLAGDTVVVRFATGRLAQPIQLAPQAGTTPTATQIQVKIPNAPQDWPPGLYAVSAVISRAGEPDRTTNELPLVLAPRILTIAPNPAARNAAGDVTLTLTFKPAVLPEQRASLLLGSREVVSQPHTSKTGSLTFAVKKAVPGQHFVRLRVEGVDSLLIDRTVDPPVFDTSQRVTMT